MWVQPSLTPMSPSIPSFTSGLRGWTSYSTNKKSNLFLRSSFNQATETGLVQLFYIGLS